MSNFLNKNFVINFFIILSIFGLDRFTKVYVISKNEKNLSSELFVSKFLNINLIYNEGIAFGLLSFDQSYMYNILTILWDVVPLTRESSTRTIILFLIVVLFALSFNLTPKLLICWPGSIKVLPT